MPNTHSVSLKEKVVKEADTWNLVGGTLLMSALLDNCLTPFTPPCDSSAVFMYSAVMALCFSLTHCRTCALTGAVFGHRCLFWTVAMKSRNAELLCWFVNQ